METGLEPRSVWLPAESLNRLPLGQTASLKLGLIQCDLFPMTAFRFVFSFSVIYCCCSSLEGTQCLHLYIVNTKSFYKERYVCKCCSPGICNCTLTHAFHRVRGLRVSSLFTQYMQLSIDKCIPWGGRIVCMTVVSTPPQ